jgi:hypothetical protein
MTNTTTADESTETPETTAATPGPNDALKEAFRGLGRSALQFGISRAGGSVEKLTNRLTDYAEGKQQDAGADSGGAPGPVGEAVSGGVEAAASGENPAAGALKGAFTGVKDKIKEKLPGGGGRKSAAKKFSNIIDSFDVGVPVRVAYNQWTQFNQWSEFMKKLEFAEAKDDEGKVQFRAKIFVLHRSWESTIIDMVPDEHIVWQSTGEKGYLNGAVTFSELAPNLTRLSLAVEYHPAGFWENLINIWRSVGSRVRLETKLYIHHVMTSTQLDPDAVQGWRAEIHDKEIVRTHDEVVEQERQEQEERDRQEQEDQDERDGEDQDGDGEAPQGDDEYDDEDRTDSQDDEDESDEDEFYDEDEDEEDEDEDAYDEDQPDEDQEPYDEDESDQDESDEEERTPAGAGRNGGR